MISFEYNGKDSFKDFGIIIERRPRIPSPKKRIQYINVPGRSSRIMYDEKTYDDISITLECVLVNRENLIEKIDDIKGWLFSGDEGDLVFSYQKGRKYRAHISNVIEFTQIFSKVSRFPIIFTCRPFKYSSSEDLITLKESGEIVKNGGTFFSQPIIEVLGSGDIDIIINDDKISLSDVKENIIINSEIQDAYSKNRENLNNQMEGEFPTLKVGDNKIMWIGNVDSLKIKPNWRWL